jgi:hypothetical protein
VKLRGAFQRQAKPSSAACRLPAQTDPVCARNNYVAVSDRTHEMSQLVTKGQQGAFWAPRQIDGSVGLRQSCLWGRHNITLCP